MICYIVLKYFSFVDSTTPEGHDGGEPKRKGRGQYKGSKLSRKRNLGGKLTAKVQPEDLHVVGDYHDNFPSECLQAARRLWPLAVANFSDIDERIAWSIVDHLRVRCLNVN